MLSPVVLVLAALVLLGWSAYFAVTYQRRRQRADLRGAALAPSLLQILEQEVPLYRRMPEELQAELCGLINIFLADKAFIGGDGLVVTDEMRVVIAGNACVLLLSGHQDFFDGFRAILVYPDTYVAQHVEADGAVVTEGLSARAGESWHGGEVVLSWTDVRRGLEHPDDGNNVVLHEFAHKLDEQNGIVNGMPNLRQPEHYESWTRVLTQEFAGLVARVNKQANSVLDEYGATSPPEFFAVATEAFFERGTLMREKLPGLYSELQKLYQVDPASWADQG